MFEISFGEFCQTINDICFGKDLKEFSGLCGISEERLNILCEGKEEPTVEEMQSIAEMIGGTVETIKYWLKSEPYIDLMQIKRELFLLTIGGLRTNLSEFKVSAQ